MLFSNRVSCPLWVKKQTYAVHKPMSALPTIATAKADMPQMVMSALPPKADVCGATTNVC